MDYHRLPRKQLQALCKKNDIPANLTNAQMADALATLLNAEAKPKSDAKAWKKQCATVESVREESALTVISNVPKASTMSKKEAVKFAEEEGSEEFVTSAEHFEGNGGSKAGKTRRRDLSKLVPNAKKQEDKIADVAGKLRSGTQSERSCKITESDLSVVGVVSKKMDKKKTSASNDGTVDEKVKESIERHKGLEAEETLQAQENDGRHLRHLKKKTMPEAQNKSKVVDIAEAKVTSPCKRTTRTRAGEVTRHAAVATESSVKVSNGEEENGSNKFEPNCENRDTNAWKIIKLPVIIDLVDSDDEEDLKDQEKEDGSEPNTAVAPSENAVTAMSRIGLNKRMPAQTTLRGRKTNFYVESNANLSEPPKHVITRRGVKGVQREESLVIARIEGDKNDAESSVNPSTFSKQVVTCKGCKGGHKEVVDSTALGDTVDAVGVYVGPKMDKEAVVNAGREEDKADDTVGVSVESTLTLSECPKQVLTRRGRKGGQKDSLVTYNVEGAKNTMADITVGATVKASELLKQVVTLRGRKGDHKVEKVVNASTSSEEDKAGTVGVSVEHTVNPSVSLKQDVTERGGRGGQKEELLVTKSVEEAKKTSTDRVKVSESIKNAVARRGRKGGHKEEKVVNASSEEDKFDVVDISDEPTVNPSESQEQIVTRRGRRVGQKEELKVFNRVKEAKNIVTDVPVEATKNASESPRQVVTRKGHKVEHKEQGVWKASSEDDKVNNAVCVSVEPTVNPSECQEQVVTQRGQKGGQKEILVTDSLEEDKNNATDISAEDNVNSSESPKRVVTRRGRKGGHKEGILNTSADEGKVNPVGISVNCTANPSESFKQVVTQRGRKDKQKEELLVAKIVEQAKYNVTDIPVQATVDYEDDASVEMAANPSSKQFVMFKGQKGRCKEELVNASAKEDKVGVIDISVECIKDQEKPCSEADESDVNEKKADCRNLKGKKYRSKIQTRRIQQRQQPAKNLQQDKDSIMEENTADEMQEQSSSDTDADREKAITCRGLRRNTTRTKPDIRKSRHQEDKVDAVEKDEAKAGEIVNESVDGNWQSSSNIEVAEMKENMDNHRNLKRNAHPTRSHPKRSHTKQGSIENEVKKSSHQNTFPGNHKKDGKFNALEEIVEEHVQSGCEAGMTDVKAKLSSCRNSERRTNGTKLETKQTLGKQGSTDVKCPPKENQKRESCQKTISSYDSDKRKDITVVRYSIYDKDGVIESVNKRETQEIPCTGERDIETSFEKEVQPCGDAAEQLSKPSNLIVEIDSESGKDMVDAPACKDSKGRRKSVQKSLGEGYIGEENMQLQTSKHGSEATVNDTTIHEEEVTATNIMVEAVEALAVDKQAEEQMGEGSEKKAAIPMGEESKSEPEDMNMEEILTSKSVIELEQGKIVEEEGQISKVVLLRSEDTNESDLGVPVYLLKGSGTEFRESPCKPMPVEHGVLEKQHSQFVTEMPSPIIQVEGRFHAESLIDQNQNIHTQEVTYVECFGNKINCCDGIEEESSDKVTLEDQVSEMLEVLHAKSRLGSAEVDGLVLSDNVPDTLDENMEGQDSEFMVHFECSPEKEKLEEHQVPIMSEVLPAKSGVGYAEVDKLEALLDDVTDVVDENIEVQDSEFLVHDLLADSKFLCNEDIQEERGPSPMNNAICQLVKDGSGDVITKGSHFKMKSDEIHFSLQFTANAKEFSEKKKILSREVGKTDFDFDSLVEPLEFEFKELNQPHDDSAGDQEDEGDFEKKSVDDYIRSGLTAKAEVSEEQIVAGKSTMAQSTLFMDNYLDRSIESLEEESNLPHVVGINQSSDSAGDPEDAGFQTFLDVADLKENKLDKVQVRKVSATEDRISVLDAFLHASSVLDYNGNGSVEKKNPVSKLDVEIDNFPLLVETCEEHWDSHISEEIDHEKNIEVSFVVHFDKFLRGDEADKVKSSDYAESVKECLQNDYLIFKDEAESRESEFSEECSVHENIFISNRLSLNNSMVNNEAHEHKLRGSSSSEEDNFNEGKEKKLDKISEASYSEPDELGECHPGEISVVNDSPQDHVSLVIDDAQEYQLNNSKMREEFDDSVVGYRDEFEKVSESEAEVGEDFISQKNNISEGFHKFSNTICPNVENHQLEHIPYNEIQIAYETIPFSDTVLQYEVHGGVLCKSAEKQELYNFNSLNGATPEKQEDQIPDVETLLTEEDQMEETLVEYGTSQVESNVQVWKDSFDNLNMFSDANSHEKEAQHEQISDSEVVHTENVFHNGLQVSNVGPIVDLIFHEEDMRDIGSIDEQVSLSNAIPRKEDNHAEQPVENEVEETKTYETNIQTMQMEYDYSALHLLPSLRYGDESRKEQFYSQCYHGESAVEMEKEIVHNSADSTGVLSEPCLVNDSAENENNSGVNGMQLIDHIESCDQSEQELEEAGKIDGCNIEAYAADIVITSGLYDDSPESQGGEKESSSSGTPLKKLELMSNSDISPCSGMLDLTEVDEISPFLNNLFVEDYGTSFKKSELTSGTNLICCLGMNASAMKESRETVLTNPCKKHLYESDTPSKKSEFTSSTNVSPCSGIDDSAAEERQEVLILEPCKLKLPEFDTPSKMSESRMGRDKSLCLYTLFREDTPLKKADLTSSSNVTPCSGINDTSAEQSQEFLITEHCKLGLPELSNLSNMFEVTKSHEKSPCLDTLSAVNTPLKKTELTSSTNITPCSGINDSSAEQSHEFLITEHCQLGLPELSTLSNMFEVVKSHDKSPWLDRLSGENTPLKKTELTSSTTITPCLGLDDSAAKWGQEGLMTEDCNLNFPEVDCPSNMLELPKGHDKALCLDALSGEDTPLKKTERISTNTMPLSGTDDSSTEQNNDVLLNEACKLQLSELNTLLKIFDCTKDNGISPCLNTLCVEDFGTTLKKSGLTSNNDTPTCSGMDEFSTEHNREVLPMEACQLDLSEINTPSKVPELTKDSEISPCLNTLFAEDIGLQRILACSTDMPPFSGMGDSGREQSGKILQKEACKLDHPDLNDHNRSPCLNTLFVEDVGTSSKNFDLTSTSDLSACSVLVDSVTQDVQEVLPTEDSHHELSQMDDSAVEQSCDVFPTEIGKLEPLELNPPLKMPELTKDYDRSPCQNTLVVDNIVTTLKNFEHPTCSGIDNSVVEHSGDVLTIEACKLLISELNTPLKETELTKDHDRSPCLHTSVVEDIAASLKKTELTRGLDDSAVEQCGDDLPTEACKLDLFELNTPSDIPNITKDHVKYHCLNTLFVENIAISLKKPQLTRSTDMNLSSGMDDTAIEQGGYACPTEVCKPELFEMDTMSKMAEFTKDNDRSTCLNTLLLEEIGTSSEKPVIRSSTHVQCCSGLNDSVVEQSKAILPMEVRKQEHYEFDTPLKASKLTNGHSLSPCLNTLAGDLRTALEMPQCTNSTDISACSGVADSVLHKMQEICRAEDFKHEHSQMDTPLTFPNGNISCSNSVNEQSSSTPSEMPKLSNIDYLLQCVGMDDSAPEQSLVILPKENSNQRCYQFDTRLKMGEPMEGHNNPCSHSKLAVESDLTKFSLRQLQRMYKAKLIKQKESEKMAGKHPALQVFSSSVFGEESNSFRKCELTNSYKVSPFSGIGDSFQEQSQQTCRSDLGCNNELSEVDTPLNKPEVMEAYNKLDRPDEYSTGSNDVLHQASVAGIRSPDFTNSCKVSSCSGIDDPILEQSQQACQTDVCCNNEPSQVNIPLSELEVTEAYDKLDRPDKYSMGSNDVLHQASVAGIRLPELTNSCKPSQVNTPLNESEVTEGYGKLDRPEKYNPGSNNVLHPESVTGIRLQELTNSYEVSSCSGIDNLIPEESHQACVDLCCNNKGPSQVNTPLNESESTERYGKLDKPEEYNTGSDDDVLHPASMAGIRLQELTNSYEVSLLEQSQEACWRDLGCEHKPSQIHTPSNKSELAKGYNKPEQYSAPLEKLECTGGYDVLCESSMAGIKSRETSFLDEREFWVCEEEPLVLNNSVETGLFVEGDTVCMKTPPARIGESRKTSLANRLENLTNRLLTIQRNLQGQTQELSYATPLRKPMNHKSTGSSKKSRFPVSGSAKKSRLVIESDKLASTKENPIDQIQLSLKKDQRLHKEKQIKSKDSEKVVGKRPALQNLSSNVLEQRVDQTLSEKRILHIHEEDCS